MDELTKLLELVADDKSQKAKKLEKVINEKIEALDAEVNKQEGMKIDAIKTRDEAKTKLKAIVSKLGVSDAEDVDDAIDEIKNRKGGEKSEVHEKEIEQLKKEIATSNATLEDERKGHETEILKVALEKDIATTLPKYQAKTNAFGYIVDAVKKQAKYEDGKVVFKNEDGTTLRANGSDATLDDVIKGMQEEEKKSNQSMFFDIDVQQSGANGSDGGKPSSEDFQP